MIVRGFVWGEMRHAFSNTVTKLITTEPPMYDMMKERIAKEAKMREQRGQRANTGNASLATFI